MIMDFILIVLSMNVLTPIATDLLSHLLVI